MPDTQELIEALEPCPLCGLAAEIWRAHPENPKRKAWIACTGKCCIMTREYLTDEEAIAAWNTRARSAEEQPTPPDDLVEVLLQTFRALPLHGDAGCDKLTDDEWRAVAQAVLQALSPHLSERESDTLSDIATMMSKHVVNWPEPKKLKMAIALIDKTLDAALKNDARPIEAWLREQSRCYRAMIPPRNREASALTAAANAISRGDHAGGEGR